MVRGDGIDDDRRHFKPLGVISPQLGVCAFLIVIHSLAQVMEQGAHLGRFDVGSQLRGQHGGDMGRFDGVLQLVLSIGCAVSEPP